MRPAEVLVIDGESESLRDVCAQLEGRDDVHLSRAVGALGAYQHLSEHRFTDIAVVNASADFTRHVRSDFPLPHTPYQPALELREQWKRDVILCEPDADADRLEKFRDNCRSQKFIAASRETVLAEIAFLTRIMPGITPMKLPPQPMKTAPVRRKSDGLLYPPNRTFIGMDPGVRERFEVFLAGMEAARSRR